MPQVNYPVMLSVDWLQIFCKSLDPIKEPPSGGSYEWVQRDRGTKFFKIVWDINLKTDDHVQPFCTLCSIPTSAIMQATTCSLKMANFQLYQEGWYDKLVSFLQFLGLSVLSLSRIDLAADFLFLRNRVSGAQLVKNIKSCKWLKAGTAECVEYFTLPYSIKWQRDAADFELQEYSTDNSLTPATRSLTFGKSSSLAQVQIYDKTKELHISDVDGICHKQYIEDAHKAAGVYDEKRHTWRIEIRISSRARTIVNTQTGELRGLGLYDVSFERLAYTFRAAADTWFRLYDAAAVIESKNITACDLRKLAQHKTRLPEVKLFDEKSFCLKFVRSSYHPRASRFTKCVINRCEQLADSIEHKRILSADITDAAILRQSSSALKAIYNEQVREERSEWIYQCQRRKFAEIMQRSDAGLKLTDEDYRSLHNLKNEGSKLTLQDIDEITNFENINFNEQNNYEQFEDFNRPF